MNAFVFILAIIGGIAIVAVVAHLCNKAYSEFIEYKFFKDNTKERLRYLDQRLNETRSWCEDLRERCSKLESAHNITEKLRRDVNDR